ncbi:hypothetical protein V491_07649 [Pseudogymnoascus sp. VKM F-3775]|nr:hypothetical protein V491_07649 [Pseudogymnoascus sp. VKM F-3775]
MSSSYSWNTPPAIPQEFLEMKCRRVYIDLLKNDTSGLLVEEANRTKNHATFKIDFESPYDNQYEGVRLSMEIFYEMASNLSQNGTHRYKPGHLLLKPITYAGPSRSSVRNVQIPHAQGSRLVDLLNLIMRLELQLFYFTGINDNTQALYQLCSSRLLRSGVLRSAPAEPRLQVDDAFKVLGMRFTVRPPGKGSICPVDKGVFPRYVRVEERYMPYERSQAAQDLAIGLAR